MRSRVDATSRLVKEISALSPEERPKLLLSSSAVGFYGISQTSTFTEDSPSGSDYLAQVCREWEAAASGAKALGLRTVVMRTGIVLAREGGALGKMLPIFSLFAGGPLGTGKQWMSWIHREDLVDLILLAIEDESFDGVYNATAPRPIRMSEFCSTLGSLMGRPSWLPVPDFALLTILGEGASVVLEGQKVLPTRTQAQGFKFQYTDIEPALKNLLR